MDADLKTKWLTALRSGEYKQAKQCLRTVDDGYCCLGVLCDVSGKGRWEQVKNELGETYNRYEYDGDWQSALLRDNLREAVGLNKRLECGHLVTSRLMCMNDDEGKSFAEIADFIEANL